MSTLMFVAIAVIVLSLIAKNDSQTPGTVINGFKNYTVLEIGKSSKRLLTFLFHEKKSYNSIKLKEI